MKKIISIICIFIMIMSLVACNNNSNLANNSDTENSDKLDISQKDYSNSTVVGKVIELNDSKVTVTLGELTEEEMSNAPQGQPPQGENSQQGENPQGNMPQGQPPQGENSQQGENPQGNAPQGQPPQDENSQQGENPQGNMPQMSGKINKFTIGQENATFDLTNATISIESMFETKDVVLSDIKVDDVLQFEIGDSNIVKSVKIVYILDNNGDMMGGMSGNFGGSGEIAQGTAANTIDSDGEYSSTDYTSSGDDENALRVDGATVTLSNINVNKSSGKSSNTEDGDFYGMNSGLLATNGATVTIKNSTITTNAKNGNGVFSYGSGTVVNISDCTITTSQNNSGGIQTTGGGTTNASNLTISTQGNSSAAIRSDRGGGTVTVDGGTYTTSGTGSPSIYSTANITVSNAKLEATNSEAVVVEGKNSVTLNNCDLTGNMTGTYNNDGTENIHNIMIYQSMSGDADVGTATFTANGGKIVAKTGDMFYITNTHAVMMLEDVELILANDTLLRVEGNSSSRGWGKAGANGGQLEFTASNMSLKGNIIVDTISSLNMTLSDNTTFEGAINIVENSDGGTAVTNNSVVTVDAGCTWTLTGNCTISSLTNNGVINFNGYTITLSDGTILSK